jgi:hypothetical protein
MGGVSGPEGIRTPDLFSAIDPQGSSNLSTAYIWWKNVYFITIYGGHHICTVHNFHAVPLGLHPA